MPVELSFVSIIILKASIEEAYDGGLTSFVNDYRIGAEDEYLIAIHFMGQYEAEEMVSSLISKGLYPCKDISMSDRTQGELIVNHNIEIIASEDDVGFKTFDQAHFLAISKKPVTKKYEAPEGKRLNISPSQISRAAKLPEGSNAYIARQKSKLKS